MRSLLRTPALFLALSLVAQAQTAPDVTAPAVQGSGLGGTQDLLNKLASDVNISSLGGAEVVDFQKGIFRYKDAVRIEYKGVEILGNGAEFNRSTGDITVRGDISIFRAGILYKGSSAVYNINNDTIASDNLRSSLLAADKEIYFQTQELASSMGEGGTPGKIETNGSYLTTHDLSHPNWHIESKELDIYPEDRMVFKNMTIYAGGTPVFWLPYLSQPMDDELGYSFSPGYDTVWGAYLLNRYGTLMGKEGQTLTTYRLDLRSERGLAGGVDFRSMRQRDNENFGFLKTYFINDLAPALSRNSNDRTDDAPDENRYRVSLQHRFYIYGYDESVTVAEKEGRRVRARSSTPVDDSFYVDADLNLLSDEYLLEDFFPEEVRTNPQPDNYLNVVKSHPLGSLSLMGRLRVNDFYQTDTRLPEIALDTVRTPIGGSNVFYEGTSSFGVLDEQVAEPFKVRQQQNMDQLQLDLKNSQTDERYAEVNPAFDPAVTRTMLDDLEASIADRGFNRFDTYHQFSYPTTLGSVSFIPRVGVRYTNYSDVSGVVSSSSADRALVHAGFDSSVKFSREYDNISSRALGLDGLRHIVEPYIRYSLVQGDELDPKFPSIDRLTPSTRPRPIDLSRDPAIDTINNWNLFRLGAYNRWQTRRDGATYNWLEMNTYIDAFLDDPEFDRDFSNLYYDIAWMPLPWLRLDMQTQFDLMGQDSGFNEVNSTVSWMPTRNFDFSVGHRFLDGHPYLPASNQVDFRVFYRLADEWGFSAYQRWELDDSTLEMQQYSIHKDLVSWTAALGAVMRDNRGVDEFGIVFTLTLKEFPQVALPLNLDPQGAAAN